MTILKRDHFGVVRLERRDHGEAILRDTRAARWWTAWLARRLARREARALTALSGVAGVPELLGFDGRLLERGYLEGRPMQVARPLDPAYFRSAFALLRRLHRRGVAHNDLAKEPNWLVTPQGLPALVDFQLASIAPRRGRLFRLLAHDDLRHLLKHKRSYLPERLTARQRRILATPSILSRAWRASGKRFYVWVTRRLLGWRDREGAGDRQL